jgi:hypothetical protein
VPAQIESFRDAMSRDSILGIPFNKFFSICGNYDSVIFGQALRVSCEQADAKGCEGMVTDPIESGKRNGRSISRLSVAESPAVHCIDRLIVR